MIKKIGIAAIAIAIFMFGYYVGITPTSVEQQAASEDLQYKEDLYSVSGKYANLYSLCEEKYQAGIDGDLQTAFELKGRMNGLEEEIQTILGKYDYKTN